MSKFPPGILASMEFSGENWFWRGSARWHFIAVPDEEYGEVDIVPVKSPVRNAEGLELGDIVTARLTIGA
jgi:hypothetical protein